MPEAARSAPAPEHPTPTKARKIRRDGNEPLRRDLRRLAGVDPTRIDGINAGTALTLITEVGLDTGAFPTEKHFVAWMRLSPKMGISGGRPVAAKKRVPTASTRAANALRMAATSLRRSPSALGAQFRRLAWRKGAGVAIFAMARRLAQLVYRMLRYGRDYVDEGAQAYEQRHRQRRLRALANTAQEMGYDLVPAAPAS